MSDDQFKSIRNIVPMETMARKRVTQIGLGRAGSPVAIILAQSGVATHPEGRMRLFDGDRLEAHNLVGGLGFKHADALAGTPKVEAIATTLRAISPEMNVSYAQRMVTRDTIPEVVGTARQSDLMILTADDVEIMLAVSDACHGVCPCVTALFADRCETAEVAFSVPGQTPPLSQTLGQRRRERIGGAEALACDTLMAAAFTASLCLQLLVGPGHGREIVPVYADAPLYLVGLRRTWLFERMPADQVRSIVLAGVPASGSRSPVARRMP